MVEHKTKTKHLSGHSNLIMVLIADGALPLVPVIKCDAHGCLRNAGLTMLIDQLLQATSPHLTTIFDS